MEIEQAYVLDIFYFDIDDEMTRHESELVISSDGINRVLADAKKFAKAQIRELDVYYDCKISQIVPVLAFTSNPDVPEDSNIQIF